MADLIDRQAAIDALDALCDRECEYSKKQRSVMCGACHLGSAFDVIEQMPSAQPESSQSVVNASQSVVNDCISRRAAIDVLHGYFDGMLETDTWSPCDVYGLIEILPSAQPTLCGYDIEHLILIANVLRKENLPPERVVEALTDIGRIVSIVTDEFEESLRKAVEQCKI